MKPEYQFKVEKLTNKEQVVSGLLSSGYILSVKERFGFYEVSVYGKERVDGNGLKSDWTAMPADASAYIKTPYYPSTTAYLSSTTVTSAVDAKDLDEQKMKDIIKKAIDNNYGC